MTRICYAQNFEDVILWRALGHIANGHYLDIGAQHPEIDSVSKSFHNAGWRGVHVEPVPAYAAALREDRPDDIVIEAAVGQGQSALTIQVFEGTGLSTVDVDIAAAHIAAGHGAVPMEVQQVSLESLLDRFEGRDLHWMKVDVKGAEADVLSSWGNSTVRPWVVIVEAIDPLTAQPTDHQWRNLIEQRGYHEALCDGVNRFFVAEGRDEVFDTVRAPANSLDDFIVPWHHWVAANAVDLFRREVEQLREADESAQANLGQARTLLADALSDLDRSNRERKFLSEGLEDLRGERLQLSHAMSLLGEELSARRAEADRLQVQIRDAVLRNRSVMGQLHAVHDQLAHHEHQRDELTGEAARLRSVIAERDHSLASLAAEISELRDHTTLLAQEAAIQSARLRRADQIAALANREMHLWHSALVATLFKKGRQIRKELRMALDHWPNSTGDAPGTAVMDDEGALATMNLFACEHRDPFQRAPSLNELCDFADRDFVRCAFVTMLGRQPDPQGEAYYLRRLRDGESMLTILWALRRSGEGRAHDPGITGLDRTLRKHRNANLPVVGWLVRLLTGREGNSAVERRLRTIANTLTVERNLAAARAATVNHIQIMTMHRLDCVEKELKVALAGQAMTPRQIDRADAAGDTQWEAILASVMSGR
jgi:FkbM family methyltransferase